MILPPPLYDTSRPTSNLCTRALICPQLRPTSLWPDLIIYDYLASSFVHAFRRYNIISSRSEDDSLSLILILSISLVLSLRPLVKYLMSPMSLSYHYLMPTISSCFYYLLNTHYSPSPISLYPQSLPYTFLLIYWIPFRPLLNYGFYLLNSHFLLLILHKTINH